MEKREIGNAAVWSLSTAKPGNGVDQLRDENLDTYWQSDGVQPHTINIQFHKKMTICEIRLYVDCKLDESYTPKKISIRAGSTFHDLVEVETLDLTDPSGWISVKLSGDDGNKQIDRNYLRTQFVQICVIQMLQNGRDTHIRQVKIYAPRQISNLIPSLIESSTIEFSQYECIR